MRQGILLTPSSTQSITVKIVHIRKAIGKKLTFMACPKVPTPGNIITFAFNISSGLARYH